MEKEDIALDGSALQSKILSAFDFVWVGSTRHAGNLFEETYLFLGYLFRSCAH
jgi:hypothetical protein